MEYKPRSRPLLPALALAWLAACFPAPLCAQAPAPQTTAVPATSAVERYLLHVEVPEVAIYEKPSAGALVLGWLEQGTEVEADRKSGDWYRIKRGAGDEGWVLNETRATGPLMLVRPFPDDRRIAYEAAATDPRVAESLPYKQ